MIPRHFNKVGGGSRFSYLDKKKNGERINIVMLTLNVYFMYLSVASLFVIPGSEDNSDILVQ